MYKHYLLALSCSATLLLSACSNEPDLDVEQRKTQNLGIVVLAPKAIQDVVSDVIHEIYQDIADPKPTPVDNLAHVALFQGMFPAENNEALQAALRAIASNYPSFTIEMGDDLRVNQAGAIIWPIADAQEQLAGIHVDLLREVAPMTEELRLDFFNQQPIGSYSNAEIESYQNYGLPWAGEHFQPSITVMYQVGNEEEIHRLAFKLDEAIDDKQFTATQLAIVNLGSMGNAVSIVETFPLRDQ